MVQRKGGFRRKSRYKLKKNYRDSGKIPIRKHLQEFKPGEKVILAAESSVHSGMYNLRFHGKIAEVLKKEGSCYHVAVKDGGKQKTLVVKTVHLRRTK